VKLRPMESASLPSRFTHSLTLLRSNRSILLPGLAAGIVCGFLQAFLVHIALLGGIFGAAIASLLELFAGAAALTYTTGMAQVAWEKGHVELSDGKRAFEEDGGRVVPAVVLLSVAGTAAILLMLPTLGLSLLAFSYFSVYTIASVVVGRHTAIEGFVESAGIASRRIGPTAAIVVGFIWIFVIAGFIGFALSFIPLLGPVVSSIISVTCSAYFVVLIVGEYLTVRGTPPSIPMLTVNR
jgi:hypothetical protein